MKHNKKRNSAFIFEVLIRELTQSIVAKNDKKKAVIISLIKENFKGTTALARDLELYKTLLETTDVEQDVAEKLIFECRMQRCTINNQQLFKEQSELINKINKFVSKTAFNTFVPNYRNIASTYQIFNPNAKTKQRVLLEKQLINQMIGARTPDTAPLEPINNLTLKTFIKNFNIKYGENLIFEQKTLLNKYISSFADNGTELRVFLSEEITRLQTILTEALKMSDIKNDNLMLEKTQKVLEILNTTSERQVDTAFIQDTLKIQNLIKEISP